MAMDFTALQGVPSETGHLDFSAIGGVPAVGGGPSAEDETSALGAAGRGAVGVLPLGKQAYAAVAGAAENKPYLQERQELEKEIEADIANHPAARLGGQVAGVVAPALLTGGASTLGGTIAEGAAMGAGFGAGNAIDTLASGGSGAKAAGDVALGTLAGGAGGAAGRAAGNLIGKAASPFVNSQDELMAEATAGILGGTTRQIRSLPGKNPVQTLTKLGSDMAKYHVNGEPLIQVTDQMPARLDKFIALQKQAGQTIGDTIKSSNVEPIAAKPIIDELGTALKFATPDDQVQMQAVMNQINQYAEKDGTIPFDRLQQLKGELGDRAFHGQGDPVLQAAYHTVSDVQDRELEKVSSVINKPAFDDAKNAYQMTSRAIPMLRMAVSKEVGGKTNMVVPGAALLSGHPLVAAGALAKNRLSQMGSGAMFKGLQNIPENAGAIAEALPGKAGAQAGGAAVQQNMGETHPVPGKGAPSPSDTQPNKLNIDHPALAQWKPMFQQNAQNAKNPGEVEKSHAVTDFILSQRDPGYAAAKKKASEAPVTENQPAKMSEGGIIADLKENFGKPVPGFGSTLQGLENVMKGAKSTPVPMENQLPVQTEKTPKFHEPFNTDFADQLKAFLADKEKDDAESR